MAHKISSFLSFLAILAALQLATAVDYTVTNTAAATPGGVRFTNDIGVEYTNQTLASATCFIWNTFQQNTENDRKNVASVSVFIDDMDGVAYASNNEIHVSARYIQGYSGEVKTEITGLIEGIADYVRLKAGYAPNHWVQPGQGDRWDQGYDVTARFLDYCNGLRDGFVAELNKKMRDGYNDGFSVDLLGKTVDQLWAEYKAT
uniref:Plant basic secretory protein (BSP) family protein n=1 Tax=Helianthus annuus TaxID=4232 RepID=A0A251V5C1_HELAN